MTDAIKITKQHADFAGLRWAALAKAKDDHRYYFNYLYVEPKGRVIGCDGHRIHTYKTGGDWLEPGYYTVRKLTTAQILLEPANVDAKYPDWERVLYDLDESSLRWIQLPPVPDAALYRIIRNLDVCLNYGYVMDALSLHEAKKSRTHDGKPALPVTLDAARATSAQHILYLRHGETYHAAIASMRSGMEEQDAA